MISRHWTGICRRDRADAYIHHLRSETFPALTAIAGFVRASILKRDVERGTEFQIVTIWESLEAIKSFSGEETDAAVVPLVAQAMMVEFDSHVSHYEVVHTTP
jgi:heme-degrading monooxygenase HmoA